MPVGRVQAAKRSECECLCVPLDTKRVSDDQGASCSIHSVPPQPCRLRKLRNGGTKVLTTPT
eukprot:276767-Karenia_brevis.AAC.1